jgi:hypothetical protein
MVMTDINEDHENQMVVAPGEQEVKPLYRYRDSFRVPDYDQERAFDMFWRAEVPSLTAIAQEFKVAVKTVGRWKMRHNWVARRTALRAANAAVIINAEVISAVGAPQEHVKEQIKLLTSLRDAIWEQLDKRVDVLSPGQLLQLVSAAEKVGKEIVAQYASLGIDMKLLFISKQLSHPDLDRKMELFTRTEELDDLSMLNDADIDITLNEEV